MAELEPLRTHIDSLDDQILGLLQERFEAAEEIAALKAATGAPALDEERWQAIEERIRSKAEQAGLSPEGVMQIYRAIHGYVLDNIYGKKSEG